MWNWPSIISKDAALSIGSVCTLSNPSQTNEEVKNVTADYTLSWRSMFAHRLEKINQLYPMKIDISINDLSDIISTIIEDGIIMSRTLSQQKILAQQILQYRNCLWLTLREHHMIETGFNTMKKILLFLALITIMSVIALEWSEFNHVQHTERFYTFAE